MSHKDIYVQHQQLTPRRVYFLCPPGYFDGGGPWKKYAEKNIRG